MKKVIGFVDGQPVFYEETEPATYEAEAELEIQPSHDVEITAVDDHDNSTTMRSIIYMSGWIEPVVDRILQDIKDRNERAYLNYWDLNRIEQNTEYLADLLNGYGYNQNITHKTDWLMGDFPYSAEMERVRTNVLELLEVYHEQETPLPTTLEKLDWKKLNALENNLKLMYEMIGRMEAEFPILRNA